MKEEVNIIGEKQGRLNIKVFKANYWERIIGLMFKTGIDFGLIIPGTSSIHTCFMKEEIDVVFINKEGTTLKILEKVSPWKPWIMKIGASTVIELPAGTLKNWQLSLGERIDIKNV